MHVFIIGEPKRERQTRCLRYPLEVFPILCVRTQCISCTPCLQDTDESNFWWNHNLFTGHEYECCPNDCGPGYILDSTDDQRTCFACTRGKYRASESPALLCENCPENLPESLLGSSTANECFLCVRPMVEIWVTGSIVLYVGISVGGFICFLILVIGRHIFFKCSRARPSPKGRTHSKFFHIRATERSGTDEFTQDDPETFHQHGEEVEHEHGDPAQDWCCRLNLK